MKSWPEWWRFDLVFSPHVVERMQERDVTEIDLRAMLDDATDFRPSIMSGRFVIETRLESRPWEVVVEPNEAEKTLIVVTAYRLE